MKTNGMYTKLYIFHALVHELKSTTIFPEKCIDSTEQRLKNQQYWLNIDLVSIHRTSSWKKEIENLKHPLKTIRALPS